MKKKMIIKTVLVMTILQLLITNNYPDGNCFEYNIWFVINIIIDVFATFSHFNSYYHFVFLNNVHDLHTQRHPGPAPWDQWLGQVQLIPSPSLLICFFFRFYAHYPSSTNHICVRVRSENTWLLTNPLTTAQAPKRDLRETKKKVNQRGAHFA